MTNLLSIWGIWALISDTKVSWSDIVLWAFKLSHIMEKYYFQRKEWKAAVISLRVLFFLWINILAFIFLFKEMCACNHNLYNKFKCASYPLHSLTQKVTCCLFSKWLKFFHDRIERLLHDVWAAVTSTYYDVLHSLEEEALLDISNTLPIFLVYFVFLPCLCSGLYTFIEGWNHHPLCTEGSMTPQQLWQLGLLQNSTDEAENVEVHTTHYYKQ